MMLTVWMASPIGITHTPMTRHSLDEAKVLQKWQRKQMLMCWADNGNDTCTYEGNNTCTSNNTDMSEHEQ